MISRMLTYQFRRWQAFGSMRLSWGVKQGLSACSKEIPVRIHHPPIDNPTPTGSCVGLLSAQTGVGAEGIKASIAYTVRSDDVCLC